ncbi:hypothetical protein BJ138DRAFT_264799 [Hygrophoropsis aurantiaca]|uniref:Uncharacterized protein n=1 Tax=Hygrophoropsis aurantiaca TaxID=72124 RepID=A0ACB7ZQ65_9AGAM|nr:hypothetical protein BJ138DRAFT_264799 [Hygrophoropsis aurantiaca]
MDIDVTGGPQSLHSQPNPGISETDTSLRTTCATSYRRIHWTLQIDFGTVSGVIRRTHTRDGTLIIITDRSWSLDYKASAPFIRHQHSIDKTIDLLDEISCDGSAAVASARKAIIVEIQAHQNYLDQLKQEHWLQPRPNPFTLPHSPRFPPGF